MRGVRILLTKSIKYSTTSEILSSPSFAYFYSYLYFFSGIFTFLRCIYWRTKWETKWANDINGPRDVHTYQTHWETILDRIWNMLKNFLSLLLCVLTLLPKHHKNVKHIFLFYYQTKSFNQGYNVTVEVKRKVVKFLQAPNVWACCSFIAMLYASSKAK